jgi:hypothetical protein
MKKSRSDIVRYFIQEYNSFNIDGMMKHLHPEVKFKNISGGKTDIETNGKEEFEKLASSSAAIFNSREQQIISIKEDGNKVVVDIEFRGILAAEMPPGLKAGETLVIKGKSEYTFQENLIISVIDES